MIQHANENDANAVRAALPGTYATRWIARRKAEVVEAVHVGMIGLDEALARYRLSLDEFREWETAWRREGLDGLKASHAQVHHQITARRRKTRRAWRGIDLAEHRRS